MLSIRISGGPVCVCILTNGQLFTAITQVCGIISVLHGLGNHMSTIIQVGELHNFLLFTWITVFFFNLAIPTGKVAVAAFLIEMNGQGSTFNTDCGQLKEKKNNNC